MDRRKILFLVGIVLIVILGVIAIIIGRNNKTVVTDDKLNDDILKDTMVDNLSITNQSVITRDEVSTYMANFTNTSNTSYQIDNLYIVFTVNGEELKALLMSNINIKENEMIPVSINFDRDISKATKVEYKIEKNGEVGE